MAIDKFILNTIMRAIPAEASHKITLKLLQYGTARLFSKHPTLDSSLQQELFGMKFYNPLGLAAGFDKNAVAASALLTLGFGFVEVGSVTLQPQSGNDGKRLFRLTETQAIINRLGLPSLGLQEVAKTLAKSRRQKTNSIIGINIAYNAMSSDIYEDYRLLVRGLGKYANYLAVNVSCPNVGDGKDLQSSEFLPLILQAVKRGMQEEGLRVPILLKLSPDTEHEELRIICDCAKEHGVSGLIIGNTTLSRPKGFRGRHSDEIGGLSGRPLFDLSTRKLAQVYLLCGDSLPLVGVGGISSVGDAYVKIKAGASLLQLYSGLTYGGSGLIYEILEGLPKLLARDGYRHVREAVGCEAERYAR